MARAIETSCRTAGESSRNGRRVSSAPSPSSLSICWARSCSAFQWMPQRPYGSWPSITFSPMLRCCESGTFCSTAAIPAA